MFKGRILLLLSLVLIIPLKAQDYQWQSMDGPCFVYDATSIALGWTSSSHNESRIYAVASDFNYRYIYSYWGSMPVYPFPGWGDEPYRLDGVKHVSACRDDGDHAYATVPDGEGPEEGVHYTVNSGQSWQYNSNSQPGNTKFTCIRAHPTNTDICFTGAAFDASEWSVWRTINGGSSWDDIGNGSLFEPREVVNSIKVDPNSGSSINNTTIYVCYMNQGIWKNTAGGADQNWVLLDIEGQGESYDGIDIAISSQDSDKLIAVIEYQGQRETWRSPDGGQHWQQFVHNDHDLFYPGHVSKIEVGYYFQENNPHTPNDDREFDQIWAIAPDSFFAITMPFEDIQPYTYWVTTNPTRYLDLQIDPYTPQEGDQVYIGGSHIIFWSAADCGGGWYVYSMEKGTNLANIKAIDCNIYNYTNESSRFCALGDHGGYIFSKPPGDEWYYVNSFSYKYDNIDIHGKDISSYVSTATYPPRNVKSYVATGYDANNQYVYDENVAIDYGSFNPTAINALEGAYFDEGGYYNDRPLLGGVGDFTDNVIYSYQFDGDLYENHNFGSTPPEITDLYYNYKQYANGEYFVCGERGSSSDNLAVYVLDQSHTINLNNGLESTNKANAIIQSHDFGNSTTNCAIFLASADGIFKNYFDYTNSTSWHSSSNGIPSSVEISKLTNYQHILAVSECPEVRPDSIVEYALGRNVAGDPYLYVSADSGRSWIEFGSYFRNLSLDVNDLVTTSESDYYLAAATNLGVYKFPYNVVSGSITSNQTWGPGLVIVNGDVSVDEGAELTIASPCTVLVTYSYDRTQSGQTSALSEINVYGALSAHGSPAQPIVFTTSRTQDPHAGDWQGIYLGKMASADLSNCRIEYAKNAIVADKDSRVALDNCSIRYAVYGLTGKYPTIVNITHSVFLNNKMYAANVLNAGDEAIFDGVVIEGAQEYGIKYYGGTSGRAQPIITNCDIEFNAAYPRYAGIFIERDSLNDKPRPEISYTNVSGYAIGIQIMHADRGSHVGPSVTSNHNTVYGILLSKSTADVMGDRYEHNHFDYNWEGMFGENSHGKVRRSHFENNTRGIDLYYCDTDFGRDAMEEEGLNTINNTSFNLAAYNIPTIWALNNYWGTTDPEAISDKVTANVQFIPFLLEPPLAKTLTNDIIPDRYELKPAYPNPFNAETQIEFAVPQYSQVSIAIYNVLGQEIRILYEQETGPGFYSVIWDGKNKTGESVASGVYFYALKTNSRLLTEKLVLLK